MKKEELAYFAGLMDGEGCFNINFNKKRNTYQARLTMSNTNLDMINWCRDRVGGKIYLRKKYFIHYKDKWEWMSWGDKETLLKLLKNTLPYLVGKKEQCKVLIRFQKNKSTVGIRLSKVNKAKQIKYYKDIKKLNSPGLAQTK